MAARRTTRKQSHARQNGLQPQIRGAGGGNIDWETIRARAAVFADAWKGETSETAEAQSFWNDFFPIFGRARRGLAWYEYHAKTHGGASSQQGGLPGKAGGGRVDLLWPGVLAVEHKSAGKDIKSGENQLRGYIDALPDEVKPRYGLVCDFARFRLIDSEQAQHWDFTLAELPGNVERFAFFVENSRREFTLELQASRDAVRLMGRVYDALRDCGYDKDVDRLLVRLLFCMFADDTGIFNRRVFLDYLEKHTKEDGGDLGSQLNLVFQTLNTHEKRRQKTLAPDLQKFPFVNGALFDGHIDAAAFDRATRAALLEACRFNWSRISPDIFGSLFQTVRDSKARREGGEHYTTEANIMKALRPLFLDKLENALSAAGKNKRALTTLHNKIAAMRFLDPACGCGNFLIVAYRELRRLEMEILWRLHPDKRALDISAMSRVNVDRFYGIEIDPFPALIAQAAMWLVDHQMNTEASKMFGNYFMRIPLTTSPCIVNGNALEQEWDKIVKRKELSYIFGNPPFVGSHLRSPKQQADMACVFNGGENGVGVLDYVTAWYMKAARYIRGTSVRCAFVSTNSVTQGDQVAPLWGRMQAEGVKIHFAHRTFRWDNEANGKAQVYVVIIGFGCGGANGKAIYEYENVRGDPRAVCAAEINGYLVDAPDIFVESRNKPLCSAPEIVSGNVPNDGGHLLLSREERKALLKQAPGAKKFLRPAVSGGKYLHGEERWCLWLADAEPSAYRKIKPVMQRLDAVRKFRAASKKAQTRELAKLPHLFGEIRQPKKNYILVPLTSSEHREYVPMGFMPKSNIALKSCAIIPGGDTFHFGVMSSAMHMAWMRTVCGRLENRYRYSNKVVYNNFPWPEKISAAQREKIRSCARAVLEARDKHPYSTLADLYSNPPPDLVRAHRALDLAVDRAYRARAFKTEQQRISYLFAEYLRLTTPATPPPKTKRARRKAKTRAL